MPHTPETHPGGHWVANADMPSQTNIVGRAYKMADGRRGTWAEHPNGAPIDIAAWYFAPPEPDKQYECRQPRWWESWRELAPQWIMGLVTGILGTGLVQKIFEEDWLLAGALALGVGCVSYCTHRMNDGCESDSQV